MKLEDVKKRLADARAAYDNEIVKIAEEVRTYVIVPLCKKRKMEFLSGNGTYFLTSKEGHVQYRHETNKRDVLEAMACLDLPLDGTTVLGQYVADVREEDLK